MSYGKLSARQAGGALIAIAAVSLASCGGGSAPKTSAPVPDPTPPVPQATSFSELTGDHQFTQAQASGGELYWLGNAGFSNTLSITSGEVEYGTHGSYELSLWTLIDPNYFSSEQSFGNASRVASRSDDQFSVYSTSNAEIALLEPGDDASGYDYVSMAVMTETTPYSLKYSALAFGFPTPGVDLPSTGSATYGGGMVGSAYLRENQYTSEDIGVLNGPAELKVDFAAEEMSIQFGGFGNSPSDSIRYRSLITGEEKTFPNIGFSNISLARTSNQFTSDHPFLGGLDLMILIDPVMQPTGRLQGAFYGPASGDAPSELGGNAYIESPAFSLAFGFVAKKDSEPESFDFDGVSPKFIALEGALTGRGGGLAPASAPADFVTAADLDTNLALPSSLYVGTNLSPADLPDQYIADSSSAEELAFSMPTVLDIPQLVLVDTQEHDRFGLAVPRFVQAAAIHAPQAMPQSPLGLDIEFKYAVFGEGIPAPDLPVTGIGHFSGTAEGKLVSALPPDGSTTLSSRVFDFQSDMNLDIDFARLSVAARLSGYQWPTDLKDVIDPRFATEIAFEAPLDRSNNAFARYSNLTMMGRLYRGTGGDMEVAGVFDADLTPGTDQADHQDVSLSGMFGGGLSSMEVTGDPPAAPGGMAAGMVDSLFAATDARASSGTPALLDFLMDQAVFDVIPLANPIAVDDSGSSVTGSREQDVLSDGAGNISYTISAGEITSTPKVVFSVNAATLAAARQSGHFVVQKGNTQTGGDVYLALAKPGSNLAGMDYTSFGAWTAEEPTKAFSYGFNILGQSVDPPTSGTASYVGNVIGLAASIAYADGVAHASTGEVGTVLGRSNLDVDFASSDVDITFDQMSYTLPDGTGHALGDMTFSAKIDDETGWFQTYDPTLGGGIDGSFFGPGTIPEEVAGTWSKDFQSPIDPEAQMRAIGVFNGKRQ